MGFTSPETWKREEIPYSSRIVPRGLSVAGGPQTALHNATHLYSDQANLLEWMQRESRTCKLLLGFPIWLVARGTTGNMYTGGEDLPPRAAASAPIESWQQLISHDSFP